jgi:hypothetical protein
MRPEQRDACRFFLRDIQLYPVCDADAKLIGQNRATVSMLQWSTMGNVNVSVFLCALCGKITDLLRLAAHVADHHESLVMVVYKLFI